MGDLKKCAGPGCPNLEDPRWGGFCDGHGAATEEQRASLLDAWREQNAKTAALRALLAEAVNELQFDGLSTGDHFALIERIRKELGK